MWMWEEAKRFAEHTPQIDLSELNRKQALSLERINAWEEAAQMHAASQDYARAIQIFAQVRLFYFVTSYDWILHKFIVQYYMDHIVVSVFRGLVWLNTSY